MKTTTIRCDLCDAIMAENLTLTEEKEFTRRRKRFKFSYDGHYFFHICDDCTREILDKINFGV
jgi:hypothetical protein